MPTAFERADLIVSGSEGGYSIDPRDPGNWTGGKAGVGVLRGTKYGIAASAHPNLDISALTLADAQAIRKAGYWDPIRGDDLPPTLALIVYDASVNSGPHQAAVWLQAALGVAQDGVIGSKTLAAVAASAGRGAEVMAEYLAQRTVFLASLPTWPTFKLGWARRLAALPWKTAEMVSA